MTTGLSTAPAVWASERHSHHTVSMPAPKPGTAVPFRAATTSAKDPAVVAGRRAAERSRKPVTWLTSADAAITTSRGNKSVEGTAEDNVAGTAQPVVTALPRSVAAGTGMDGGLLKISLPAEATNAGHRISVRYAGFADAYGGDFGSRLTLVQLPACALTTPARAQCRTRTPLVADNDVAAQTLTASLPTDAVTPHATAGTATPATLLIGLASAAKSGAGSYQATSLTPSGTWSAGGSSGDFSWSYPMAVPPAPVGPAPQLAITYDSQSVDGRLPSTNNQPSWIGEGFELPTSYIERSYDSCDDDGVTGKYDECWAGYNATLVLNGKATPLVRVGTSNTWRPKDDDGERVTLSSGTSGTVNGDDDGEFWTVTTTDGTQYMFGKNRLPGWSSGKAETNSTWTVPVYGDDSGEPGYANSTAFSGRALTQAWRWNLDYVVDTHHNSMSYWYTKETNAYGQNGNTTTTGTTYDRGGFLARIDYGITDSTVYGTAPNHVDFTTAERCLPVTGVETCGSLTATTAKDWPDVPYDQICGVGTVCKNTPSPTFFSRRRLTTVTTRAWDSTLATPGYRNVDTWTLGQSFVDPGDGTSASLWLNSITRTGLDGTSTPMPPVTFEGIQLTNRVDTSHDDIAALVKWRVRKIHTETGSVITVNYNNTNPQGQCVAGTTMPTAPDSNTLLCYPVIWTPPTKADAQTDYFNKFRVEQVVESDPTGGAPLKETDYTYNGTPAWHYADDDPATPASRRTWSQWRGYGSVTVTTGDAQSTRTKTTTTYFRGMDGDKLSSGTRHASVTDSTGTAVTDSDPLAGQVREAITYNGSSEVSGTITGYWIHDNATGGDLTADYVRPSSVTTRTDRSSGAPRTTKVTTTYDPATGEAVDVDDSGDAAVTGDEQCTHTTYADNTDLWIRAAPIEVRTVDVACSQIPALPDDVVSDVRTVYDGQEFGDAPTQGQETSTQRLSSYFGATPIYQTVSTSTYDAQGRVLTVTDAAGHTTSTTYAPLTRGPLVSTVTTNAKSQATTTTFDPVRGLPLTVVDANNKRTDYAYDGLGRTTGIWLPNRSKSASQQPNLSYTYSLSATAAPYVRTGKLRNDGTSYDYTYAIYDAMLRPRQTQVPAPGGGRVITETKYDSRGLAVESDSDYFDTATATGTLANITSAEPAQTLATYDGAGRLTRADFYADGAYKWATTTVYGGDRTTVIPPDGGVATTTLTDTLGRTTETRQYDSGTATGTYTTIRYDYNAKGQLDKVTDAGNSVWTYGYDLMGRQVTSTDPDAGTTTTAYNDLDQVESTTDSRGKTLSYTYDELGRKTGEYDAAVDQQTSDNQLASWTWDTVAKGQLTSSARYVGGSGSTGLKYSTSVLTYDGLYRPTVSRVTVPAAPGEDALKGSYSFSTDYNLDGTLYQSTDPAAGHLPSESLVYGYNELGLPRTLNSNTSGYVQDAQYTKTSQLAQLTLGTSSAQSAKWVQQSNYYDDGTQRLNRQLVTDDTGTGIVQDTHYAYDNAGNPTLTDARADGTDDTQCYRYDGHDRLTQAWTTASTWDTAGACQSDPTTTTLGSGPAPYWQSYTYDPLGNRTQLVQHATTTGAPDTTTSYTYGTEDGRQPHTLTSSTTHVDGTDASADTVNAYGYDSAGNTTSRTLASGAQSLAWDDEGHLHQASNADGTSSSYLYDADGNRLLTRDDTGTTLYLGDTEIHLDKGATTTTATRYYGWGDQTIAVRTDDGTLQWTLDDAHNTATAQIDPTTQAVTFRRTDPFGNVRGTAPDAWSGDHGFVGGVQDDTTGLTHLGARDYDPTTGRFISLDPVLEVTDPQQINGYSYASSNPVTGEDPTGLMNKDSAGGGCDDACQKDIAQLDKQQADAAAGNNSHKSHHHCSRWSVSCHVKSAVHKVAHVVKEHPVIAAVVATAVVVGAVACVAASGGACAAVLVAGAESFTAAADYGVAAATISAATSVITSGGAVIAGEVAAASAAAGALTEAAETASKADAAASAGAETATAAAKDTADSGAASGGERAAKAAPRPGPGGCSFAPSTTVLLAHGKTKPIGQIQIGDRVESADPDTGKHVGAQTVAATYANRDHDLVDVTVRSTDGKTAVLHTTSKHPFWDATSRTWTPAAKLITGHLLQGEDGPASAVVTVAPTFGTADRFNLTVGSLHTYYVLVGNTPVLVHNTCGGEERAAAGVRQGGVERTMDNSLDKTTYLNDVANKYGINLRGSGQSISVVFDPDLGPGLLGVTRAAEGGRVIRVGPEGIYDDATAANTIAHELSHARYYLKNGTFEGEIHGNAGSMADGTPYGSGNALQDWIEGNR
jgi:RHS repeat-associated protein